MSKPRLISISTGRSPLMFFLLVFVISAPFWWVGSLTGLQLFPGLPVSSLMVVAPALSAVILVYREDKAAGVVALLKRSFDFQRIKSKAWYAPIVLLIPGAIVLTYGLRRLLGLRPPTSQFSVLTTIVMFVVFCVAALGEELGWSGYAIDPMQARWNALQASILLGSIWAVWHIATLVQAQRTPEWIAWWCLFTVASRVLTVWLYNSSGKSVFAAVLYHAISNVATVVFASYFDPRLTGLIVAFAAAIVAVMWGPKLLERNGSEKKKDSS